MDETRAMSTTLSRADLRFPDVPRLRYTSAPTEITYLPRVTKFLKGPKIYVKRDDQLGLAFGGNKTRKLEYLVADALLQGADTLVTGGGVQSNHCRLTASATKREGLRCVLVLQPANNRAPEADVSGNRLLYELLGVDEVVRLEAGENLKDAIEATAAACKQDGYKPYTLPIGGSNALGSLGYVACGQEILEQASAMGIRFDSVVCASGSGGTQAGLVSGLGAEPRNVPVLGISVRDDAQRQTEKVRKLCDEISEVLGKPSTADSVSVLDDYVGGGYTLPTEAMAQAVELFARLEGIVLDPVYTGKAAAGLIDQIGLGTFTGDQNVLLLHTGGSPAIFGYPAFVTRKGEK